MNFKYNPSLIPNVSERAYDADPAKMGIASSPVPIIPIAKRRDANSPANGLRARAAWSAVSMWLIPAAPTVPATVKMMKNMTRFEKNIPNKVSVFRSFRSWSVNFGIPAPMLRISFFSTSSSTSSLACQKKRYGLMVVPSMATMLIRYSFVKIRCGIKVLIMISLQSTWMMKATTIYDKSENVRYLRIFAYQ